MAPPACQPLVEFTDRLYFTTFPNFAPNQAQLNASISWPEDNPSLRKPVPPSKENPPPKYYFFTIDHSLHYESFFEDWGPLNLANVFRTLILIHELLEDDQTKTHRLVLYSSNDPRRKANSALLMCLYVMIVLRRPPWDAFSPIAELEFMSFRDAGRARPDFFLGIQDCLWGFWKALQNGLCDMNQFSVEEYEYYEKVENGDWNWITPHFIAFASPVDNVWVQKNNGEKVSTSALQRPLPIPYQNCLDYFEKRGVQVVVRLNQPLYDKQQFIDRGIEHMELYFDDGTNPSDEIVRKFIALSERVISNGGVVAVHCKAGLGRTGTLIGAYLIWKYGFTANEAIAFMRICRPGSVVGPQQHFIYLKQLEWNKWAAVDEVRRQKPQKKEGSPIDELAIDSTNDDPTTPTKQGIDMSVPPVTPSRHVAPTTAAVKNIANPPQPRKTPQKRTTVTPAEEAMYDIDPATPSKPATSRQVIRRQPSSVKPVSATPAQDSATSEPGNTRKLRSAVPKSASKAPAPRIPRLDRSKDTNSAVPQARARPVGRPLPLTTPSRLPTLIPAKRSYIVADNDSGAEGSSKARSSRPISPSGRNKSPARDGRASPTTGIVRRNPRRSSGTKPKLVEENPSNEFLNGEEANSVVVPGSKSERPLLRNVKRRRSSFSAVDVVA